MKRRRPRGYLNLTDDSQNQFILKKHLHKKKLLYSQIIFLNEVLQFFQYKGNRC
jgi:hypothetical protein